MGLAEMFSCDFALSVGFRVDLEIANGRFHIHVSQSISDLFSLHGGILI